MTKPLGNASLQAIVVEIQIFQLIGFRVEDGVKRGKERGKGEGR